MVASAIVASTAVTAGASIHAGKKAADAQKEAARQAQDTELEMFYQNREDFAPYRETGQRALEKLAGLYGIGSQPQPMTTDTPSSDLGFAQPVSTPDYSEFYQSPDYQFAYDQGMRAVEQSLAKRGMGGPQDSGAAMKELARFGSGLASQQFGNYKNSLAQLAGIGQSATQQLGLMGQQVAGNVAGHQQTAGDARASSYLNTGSAISDLAQAGGQYQLMKAGGYFDNPAGGGGAGFGQSMGNF